jgi:hypothetical protein
LQTLLRGKLPSHAYIHIPCFLVTEVSFFMLYAYSRGGLVEADPDGSRWHGGQGLPAALQQGAKPHRPFFSSGSILKIVVN